MTREEQIIARSKKSVITETTYALPHDAPVASGWNPNKRVRPNRIVVKEFDDGEFSVTVTGYRVKKDGTRHANGAAWHGVSYEDARRYEQALGFVRVPKN